MTPMTDMYLDMVVVSLIGAAVCGLFGYVATRKTRPPDAQKDDEPS